MKLKKWLWIPLIIALASTSAVAQDQQTAEEKAAVVNGSVIGKAELDREMARVKSQLDAMGRPISEERLSQIREQTLDNLIEVELLYQASQEKGYEVEESSIDEKLEQMRQRFPSESDFEAALARNNLTVDEVKSQMRKQLAIQELVENQITHNITVSDEESKAYYDTNPDLFTQPEQVQASHILIKIPPDAEESEKAEAREKIEEVRQKLDEGGNFAELAKEYSEGPSATKGGELGYFRRGQMVKPFEDAAFGLEIGEVSDIVETQFGYHLVTVTDKKAESVVPYADIKTRLQQFLRQQKVKGSLDQYVHELQQEAEVEKFLTEDTPQASPE